jgi:hypothetical protein
MAKPRIFNGTIWIEFDTQAEYEAYIATNSPTPDLAGYLKNELHEQLGKEVVRNLYRTLRDQALTQANEADLLNRIYPVLGTLSHGFIRGARTMANNLVVGGQLTQVRKDYLIARIDEAILLM